MMNNTFYNEILTDHNLHIKRSWKMPIWFWKGLIQAVGTILFWS